MLQSAQRASEDRTGEDTIPDILFNGKRIVDEASRGILRRQEPRKSSEARTLSRASNVFDDEDTSVEYSADFEPLKFNMNRLPELEQQITSPQQYLDSMAQIRQRIQDVTGSAGGQGAAGATGVANSAATPWNFSFIDRDQFEEYLEKPNHIRCLPKRVHCGLFKRLFLAQELKDTPEEPALTAEIPANHLGRTRSRGRGSVSSQVSNSESMKKAIWTCQFSLDGKYMATGSKDGTVKIFKVISSPIERWEMDNVGETEKASRVKKVLRMKQIAASATFSKLNSGQVEDDIAKLENTNQEADEPANLYAPVFHPSPFKVFKEHQSDVLDLDWSKNNFLLTASMDNSVKLWHLDRKEALRSFQHADFVTGVKFHPTDDRFFVTSCLDHKCRLWSIIDDEVSYEYDCNDIITTIEISKGDGKYTIVGTFNGFIHVLLTKDLSSVLSFHVLDKEIKQHESEHHLAPRRSNGPRITGIELIRLPEKPLMLMITSNDSRIRLFDMEKKKLKEFLKGFQSGASQHKAFFTDNGSEPTIVCSSDDHWLYAWKVRTGQENPGASSERSQYHSETDKFHTEILTSSSVESLLSGEEDLEDDSYNLSQQSTPDSGKKAKRPLLGGSKLFSSLKHLTQTRHIRHHSVLKNSRYSAFHAHHAPVTTSLVAPIETSKVLSLSNDFICELTLEALRDGRNNRRPSANGDEVVRAIGTILVTTDNQGTIRVFRTDISSSIRSTVLGKLQRYNVEVGASTGAGTSGKPSMSCFTSPHKGTEPAAQTVGADHPVADGDITPRTSGDAVSFGEQNLIRTPGGVVYDATLSGTPKHSVYRSAGNSVSASSIGKLISGGARRRGKSKSKSASTSSTVPASPQRPATGRPAAQSNGSNLGLCCNVCNGTNFTQFANAPGLQRENTYSCADCGTALNNFR
ncbi:hypothetical protein DAKH74_002470 [Maudiozyma humilis]|uniref:Uncharacterized protein n=1 Tax=Maudiozyma humilis TaxID=51915 RepID=A0AAV5RR72_MAUHU|nr:hypothetical protein DAKH74_002470 [Kazachstania humilis]